MDVHTQLHSTLAKKTTVVNQACKIGRANFGNYTPMPKIGVIGEPLVQGPWDFRPLEMDDSDIPKEAWRHVELLREHGIPILQVIIGHNVKEEEEKRRKVEAFKASAEKLVALVGILAIGLLTTIAGAGAALAFGAVGLLLAVDPVLIVVLDDGGTWLCVAEWDS